MCLRLHFRCCKDAVYHCYEAQSIKSDFVCMLSVVIHYFPSASQTMSRIPHMHTIVVGGVQPSMAHEHCPHKWCQHILHMFSRAFAHFHGIRQKGSNDFPYMFWGIFGVDQVLVWKFRVSSATMLITFGWNTFDNCKNHSKFMCLRILLSLFVRKGWRRGVEKRFSANIFVFV